MAQPDRPTESPRTEGASGTLLFLPPGFLGVTQICCLHSFIDVLPFPWQPGTLMGEQETKLKIEQFIKCQSKLVCLAEVPSGD